MKKESQIRNGNISCDIAAYIVECSLVHLEMIVDVGIVISSHIVAATLNVDKLPNHLQEGGIKVPRGSKNPRGARTPISSSKAIFMAEEERATRPAGTNALAVVQKET